MLSPFTHPRHPPPTHTQDADDDIIIQEKYAVFNNVEENQASFLTRTIVKL